MKVRLLGTGSPVPNVDRAGTSLLLSVDGERILVDCGQGTIHRLLEAGIDFSEIESLFFTHQHVDHNADFFYFAIGSWTMGREQLTIYGPEGTERLLEALYSIYEEDLEYRESLDYSSEGIRDIEFVQTTDELTVETPHWRVSALPVEHSIETYAYRFEEKSSGSSVVFSGDTRMIDELSDFASGADLLIQDACIAHVKDDPPMNKVIWDRLAKPYSEERLEKLRKTHCSPREAGQIAADAGVDQLVMTHLLPYRDIPAMEREAADVFDGTVAVGEDNQVIEL